MAEPAPRARPAVRAAAIAAVAVTAFVVALHVVRPLPRPLLALLGVHRGVDLYGGAVMTYAPPPESDPAEIARRLDAWIAHNGGSYAPAAGGAYRLELPGVTGAEISAVIALLVTPGLEFRRVIAGSDVMMEAYRNASQRPRAAELGVTAEIDHWIGNTDGRTHDDYFLQADDRDALETYVLEAVPGGLTPGPAREILFEHVTWPSEAHPRGYWRTYLVDGDVPIDGSMIANARKTIDPYSGSTVVLLDFDEAGAQRFADLTARMVGDKLATVVGGEVKSAPIIESEIPGGRASIAMGGIDPAKQEAEADDLVAVLHAGPLPPGGQITDATHVAPTVSLAMIWLARGLLGVIAGAFAFALVLVLGRRTEPATRARGAATRRPPWRALVVTLCAPVALYLSTRVVLPGVNTYVLDEMPPVARGQFSAFALGLLPLLVAFIAAELVALAVPRWRAARVTPAGRRRMGLVIVGVAIVIAAVQGYVATRGLEGYQTRWGASPLAPLVTASRALVVLSLVTGTVLLGLLAGVVSTYGLGNGYSVVIASGTLIAVGRFVGDDHREPLATGAIVLAAIGAAGVALAVGWLVTRRVPDDRATGAPAAPGVAAVAGVLPLAWIAGLVAVVGLVTSLDVAVPRWVYELTAASGAHALVLGVVAVALTFALGWLLARPDPAARVMARMTSTAVAPATRAWVVAAAASAITLLAVHAAGAAAARWVPAALFDVVAIATVTAVGLDVVEDWRARRRLDLVGVWPIHQVGLAEVAVTVLARAGIAAHLRGRHHRTLLHVFGPFVPIEVMVSPDRAGEATAILRDVFDPASRGVVSAW